MNLKSLAGSYTAIVNPDINATLLRSSGYTTSDDGTQVPTYTVIANVSVQVQGVNGSDYERISNINQQAVLRTVFITGIWEGIIRTDQTGGDILQFSMIPDGTINNWKLIYVAEAWSNWTKAIVALQ